MSYARLKHPQAQAGWSDSIISFADSVIPGTRDAVDKVSGAVSAGKAVLDDPYLPEVSALVMRLKAAEAKRVDAGGKPAKGIGLGGIVGPLRLYVTTKESPVIGYAALAGILAIPFLAGYFVGKRKR